MLYIVPTPVGNLQDMTFRAIEVLKSVDLILAEDTRTSGILLQHYDIHTPLKSHHKFNEHETSADIVERLKAGANIALISDAGTPTCYQRSGVLSGARSCRSRDRDPVSAWSDRFCAGAGGQRTAEQPFLFRRFPAAEERPADAVAIPRCAGPDVYRL